MPVVLQRSPGLALYPYGVGRPRDDRDAAQDLARGLADPAAQLASLKGEANAWLSNESYDVLRPSIYLRKTSRSAPAPL